AHSMIARTAPPAITPAPGAAGFMRTFPAPCEPTTSCGMVPPVSGIVTILRRAASTALRTASETSFAFPDANQRVEREAASALHDLRDTVDGDHVLDEIAAFATRPVVAAASLAAAAT